MKIEDISKVDEVYKINLSMPESELVDFFSMLRSEGKHPGKPGRPGRAPYTTGRKETNGHTETGDFLTVPQAAKRAGLAASNIYTAVKAGRIKSTKVDGQIMIPAATIENKIKGGAWA